jgi:hypothetical protein
MGAAIPSTSLVPVQPVFTDAERLALAGFPAGYRGLTREAYTLDLRQFTGWCRARSLPLFFLRRADIETFARELEARGRARATVTRRLCTIAGFYKYAVEEELLDHSPAAHVRRPRHRPGSQRTRRAPGRRRARAACRACADLPPLPGRGRAAAGPARRRPGRPAGHPPRRDHQECQPAHPWARVHHRRPRRRGPAARRAGGRLARRPAHHHEIRPGAHQPGPARHLHRRHLHRRGSEVARQPGSGRQPGRRRRPCWPYPQSAAETIIRRCRWQRSGTTAMRGKRMVLDDRECGAEREILRWERS